MKESFEGKDAAIIAEDNINIDGSTVITRSGFGCEDIAHVVIPSEDTCVYMLAFANCSNLKTAKISEGINKIEYKAFAKCTHLNSIELPDGLSIIGEEAFEECKKLSNIRIPDTVSEIGNGAFYCCTGLGSVNIPKCLTEIQRFTFYGCRSLCEVTIPNGVTAIRIRAFSDCVNLTSIKIPDSVTKIEEWAFDGCSALTVICGENSYTHRFCVEEHLPYIFDYQYEAFHGIVPQGVERLSAPFLADEDTPFAFISYSHKDRDKVLEIIKRLYEAGWKIWYDEGLTIGDRYDETLEEHVRSCSAFLLFATQNSSVSAYIRSYEIPWAKKYGKPVVMCVLDDGINCSLEREDVVAVVDPSEIEYAFEMIGGMIKGEQREAKGISVAFDPAARNIQSGGFAYCLYSKASFPIVKTIILEAKNSGCVLFDAIENGDDAGKLHECAAVIAFVDKSFLTEEHLTGILAEQYRNGKEIAICQVEDIEKSDLPDNISYLYEIQWLDYAHGIIADMNTRLSRYLQKLGCRNATILPGFDNEVTDRGIIIKRYYGMDSEIRIEKDYGGVPVVEIRDEAFKNCINITSIVLSEGITKIGQSVFDGCINLASVVLPKGITEIGCFAFNNCSSLDYLSIPDTVRTIGACAFLRCTYLSSVSMPEGLETICKGAFTSCTSLSSITLHYGTKVIEEKAFSHCRVLSSINLPESVTYNRKRRF